MSEKIKVLIDRSKWRCGDDGRERAGVGSTKLLNREGYMCCLGFITRAVYPDLRIQDVLYPMNLGCIVPGLSEKGTFCDGPDALTDTELTMRAVSINDSKRLTREGREQQLLELFEDSPYALEFVGEYNERKD
jgi:hypothetical protein